MPESIQPYIPKVFLPLWFFSLLLAAFTSCGLRSKYIYLYNGQEMGQSVVKTEAIIQEGDRLEVKIAGLEPESSLPFYFSVASGSQASMSADNGANVFLVNDAGEIEIPVLGKISVAGLRLKEAESAVKSKLESLIRVPVVQIRIQNFMVTVLGEVKTPGYFRIPSNRITILELLAMAGDLNFSANRKEIVVIRKKEGVDTQYILDLTSKSLFTSPAYIIRQNDIVYVRPNNSGLIQPTLFKTTVPIALSIASILFTTIFLLVR